jgi:hypothetical protein
MTVDLISIETLVLELLLMVSVVAIITRRFRLPYTVVLVLAGLLLALRSPIELTLAPQLILSLFLPPLVFEAAFQISLVELRRTWSASSCWPSRVWSSTCWWWEASSRSGRGSRWGSRLSSAR